MKMEPESGSLVYGQSRSGGVTSMEQADREGDVPSPQPFNHRSLAIRICLLIAVTQSGDLQWAFLETIEDALKLAANEVQLAVRYAAEQGWLLLEGEPVHSAILCDAAAAIIEAAPSLT
jgi:hypothetical protein